MSRPNTFLSYHHSDAQLAAPLRDALEAAGLQVRMITGDLDLEGAALAAALRETVSEDCDSVVVLEGRGGRRSRWVTFETAEALAASLHCVLIGSTTATQPLLPLLPARLRLRVQTSRTIGYFVVNGQRLSLEQIAACAGDLLTCLRRSSAWWQRFWSFYPRVGHRHGDERVAVRFVTPASDLAPAGGGGLDAVVEGFRMGRRYRSISRYARAVDEALAHLDRG